MKLRYCTVDTLENFRHTISNRLCWYRNPDGDSVSSSLGGFRETTIEAPSLAGKLKFSDKKPSETDAENALIVYSSLQELTPHQASIERMWVYLCHFDCPHYVSSRWVSRDCKDESLTIREIQNHFFVNGNRGLIRDNGISRLWWLGKIAHEVDPDSPEEFLKLLLYRQDVRSALIERPSVSMNRRLLRAIYYVMREHWKNGGELFERDKFRNWMRGLNRKGGIILLDSLPDAPLNRLLLKEAELAINQIGVE